MVDAEVIGVDAGGAVLVVGGVVEVVGTDGEGEVVGSLVVGIEVGELCSVLVPPLDDVVGAEGETPGSPVLLVDIKMT